MFIICQIGAREHYAIPRALHAQGALARLFTDFWVPPGHAFRRIPGTRRLMDRWHPDLARAKVDASNTRMLTFELKQRLTTRHGWDPILARNKLFQQWATRKLASIDFPHGGDPSAHMGTDGHNLPLQTTLDANQPPITLFSYSYAALDLFRLAKSRGWRTVLGQIDPGPEEERIVAAEREKYRHLANSWQPAPASYWDGWREEVDLADRIFVNSEWSRQCLLKEGVPAEKMRVVPLVYGGKTGDLETEDRRLASNEGEEVSHGHPQSPNLPISQFPRLRVLFLGQVNLRKGVGRLLDAMRFMQNDPVELVLAGPTEIDPSAWADLSNVRWIGPVPRSEVGRHYADADLFVLPTLSDGYALTQLEALSHGLPVLASRHCGEAVIHGQNGWILDDLEPETIAAAIRRAVSEPLGPAHIHPPEFGIDDLAEALLRSLPTQSEP